MMKIFHLLQMQFQNTLFEQIGSYRSYQMYLKDSEECLQNPPNKKKKKTPRQLTDNVRHSFTPYRLTLCTSRCKQDVPAKQGEPSFGLK